MMETSRNVEPLWRARALLAALVCLAAVSDRVEAAVGDVFLDTKPGRLGGTVTVDVSYEVPPGSVYSIEGEIAFDESLLSLTRSSVTAAGGTSGWHVDAFVVGGTVRFALAGSSPLEPGINDVAKLRFDVIAASPDVVAPLTWSWCRTDEEPVSGQMHDGAVYVTAGGPRAWFVATDGVDGAAFGTSESPFASVQAAVNVSAAGDSILVNPGTYPALGNSNVDIDVEGLYIASVNRDPAEVTFDLAGAAGISYSAPEGPLGEGPSIHGITFANGTIALSVERDALDPPTLPAVTYRVLDCVFDSNDTAVWTRLAAGEVRGSTFLGNAAGISAHLIPPTSIRDCTFEDGTGIILNEIYSGAALIEGSVFRTNDRAITGFNTEAYPGSTSLEILECDISGPADGGIVLDYGYVNDASISVANTHVTNSGWQGIEVTAYGAITIDDVEVAGSANNGIVAIASGSSGAIIGGSRVVANGDWGVLVGGDNPVELLSLTDVTIMGNDGGGIRALGDATLALDHAVIADNIGFGVEKTTNGWGGRPALEIMSSTIAMNAGGGINVTGVTEDVVVTGSILAMNPGDALKGSPASVVFGCNDVYGNAQDYVGALAGLEGENGNISLDPWFCFGNSTDAYSVSVDSPCLDVPGCGRIGALVATAMLGAERPRDCMSVLTGSRMETGNRGRQR